MSSARDEIEIVNRLAFGMKSKLRHNSRKPGWLKPNETPQSLLRYLKEEVEELYLSISTRSSDDIYWECCDVANFAAMIADNVHTKTRKGSK